jgi:hypothetical protein
MKKHAPKSKLGISKKYIFLKQKARKGLRIFFPLIQKELIKAAF